MKKLIMAAGLALSFSGVAIADPIYLDVGVDFGGNADTAAGATTTGWLTQLSILYTSASTITDNDSSGTLTAGDSIVSTGGIYNSGFSGVADLSSNLVNGLEPSQTPLGGPSDNGFGGDWGLTFGFSNLTGVWTGSGFVYTSGLISMFYYDNTMATISDFIRLFDLNVVGGGDTGQATILNGYLNNFGAAGAVNGVDAGDVFVSGLGSFEDYTNEAPSNKVYFAASQDTQPLTGLTFSGGVANIGGTHNGSINFSVPEPASIAILGLGLLGLVGVRRRKN